VTYTVSHLFSGSGGCSLGFQREGFETLAAIDNDADACADLDYLLGEQAARCADIARMTTADLRRLVGKDRPDVLVSTPPCKGWSDCLPKAKRETPKYQAMCGLAHRAVHLALGAWKRPPPLIVIENVRGMNIAGRALMAKIQDDLRRHGYVWNIRTHNVGEIGGLAQNRERCLFVARLASEVPCFLMIPPHQRVRPCGDELGKLPPPIMEGRSESMHRLPQLSALNWLRLAAIPAGKDWKALPPRIRIGGEDLGVRVDDHGGQRKNGGFGVNAWGAPAHTVLGAADVSNTWSSVSSPLGEAVDPRLTCSQWAGAYGVLDPDHPSPTVLGHTRHDNAPGSYADPGLGHAPRNGSYGVLDLSEPAPTVRGCHEVRQAPGAVADPRIEVGGRVIDPRKDWSEDGAYKDRPHAYGVQPWDEPSSTIRGKQVTANSRAAVAHPAYPAPTHRLLREGDELVLVGPPIRDWDEICYLVIQAPDGSWHRPLTDLELAVLQSLPAYVGGEMLALRGPSGKRREHIGNMLPTAAAQAIARECRATLDAASGGFRLVGNGNVWVREHEYQPEHGSFLPTGQ
jgi:site-specific DNA-cytosine methylase